MLVQPCPFCGSNDVDWVLPAYSRLAHMLCEDCGAQGPRTSLGSISRNDRDGITAVMLPRWNDRVHA